MRSDSRIREVFLPKRLLLLLSLSPWPLMAIVSNCEAAGSRSLEISARLFQNPIVSHRFYPVAATTEAVLNDSLAITVGPETRLGILVEGTSQVFRQNHTITEAGTLYVSARANDLQGVPVASETNSLYGFIKASDRPGQLIMAWLGMLIPLALVAVRRPRAAWTTLIFALLLLGLISCGDDDVGFDVPEKYQLVQDAWLTFNLAVDTEVDSLYEEAHATFQRAAALDSKYEEPHHGMGWCELMLNDAEAAVTSFSSAWTKGSTSVSLDAGRAAGHLATNDYAGAIQYGTRTLARSPDWVWYEHNTEFDHHDIHLILAEAYYLSGDLTRAQAEALSLDPSLEFDPESDTYPADLAEAIEAFGQQYSGH